MPQSKKPGPVRNERGRPTASHVEPKPYGSDAYIDWLKAHRAKRAGRKERLGMGGRPPMKTTESGQKGYGGMKGRNQ